MARDDDGSRNQTDEYEQMMQWVLRTELTVAHPLATVWPVFRDTRQWYPEYTWDVVSGPTYEDNGGITQGQILKARSTHPLPRIPSGAEDAPEDYVTKVLKVVPMEEVVILISGSVYDFSQYTAFYVWTLSETESGTTIVIDTYGEGELSSPLSTDQLAEHVDSFNKNWYRSWSTAFGNLEKVLDVES